MTATVGAPLQPLLAAFDVAVEMRDAEAAVSALCNLRAAGYGSHADALTRKLAAAGLHRVARGVDLVEVPVEAWTCGNSCDDVVYTPAGVPPRHCTCGQPMTVPGGAR